MKLTYAQKRVIQHLTEEESFIREFIEYDTEQIEVVLVVGGDEYKLHRKTFYSLNRMGLLKKKLFMTTHQPFTVTFHYTPTPETIKWFEEHN